MTDITIGKLKIYTEMQDRSGNLENKDGKLTSIGTDGRITCGRTPMMNHNVLLPDGTVVLCCNDFGMEYVLGNLNYQSYDELMKSETMREVKRRMNIDLDKKLICRKCMYAEAVEL